MSPADRAKKNESAILQALATAGQSSVALGMGVNESTVSRLKDGGIGHVAALMAHAGLKVVPSGMVCFDPEYVSALRTLAGVGIRQQAPQLTWDDQH